MTQEELEYYNGLEDKWKEFYNFTIRLHPEWSFEQRVHRVAIEIALGVVDLPPIEEPISNEFLKKLLEKTDDFMKKHLSSDLYNRISPNFKKAISRIDNAIRKGLEIIGNAIETVLEKLFSIL